MERVEIWGNLLNSFYCYLVVCDLVEFRVVFNWDGWFGYLLVVLVSWVEG